MKYKKITTGLFISLFVVKAFSQPFDYARYLIDTLASETFKGRGYVENGNMLAGEFIKKEFVKLGLDSFPQGYHQYFEIKVNTFPGEMTVKLNETKLNPGKDFIVDPRSGTLNGEYDVYYTKKEDLLNEKKLKKTIKKTSKKILVIDERTDHSFDKSQQQTLAKNINYLTFSPGIANIATCIVTNSKLTWGISQSQFPKSSIILNSEFNFDTVHTISCLIDAEEIITNTSNVVAYIPGCEVYDSFLVFTAHYDHLGKMGYKTIFPGANDNASGIAMLLNLAKYFKNNPPKYSMAFIALSAEELGLLGAKHFVDNPYFNLHTIKFLINFDLAGTGDEGIKIVNGSIYKKQFEKVKQINEQKKYLSAIKSRGTACNSDHCMFYNKGVPCFYIYTLGGIQAYHNIYDRAETLPLTKFEDYFNLMIDFISEF